MNNLIFGNSVRFIVLVISQVTIFNNINFLGYINPYPYILFILLFPIKNNRLLLLILSFVLGLTIDMFLDSGGIHAASSVFIAYARPLFLKFSFGSMYDHQTIKFNVVDFGSKLTYIALLTLLHHLILFSLEIFNVLKIILVLENALFSSIFTILMCVLLSVIFSKNKT